MKYFIGYVKDEPERADIIAASDMSEVLDPNTGGYDSADGPFTKHEAYAETTTSGDHVTRAVAGCPECEDIAADLGEQR